MLRFYKVFVDDRLIGLFRAFSEKEAIDQAYMQHGSASKYTGLARHSFTAIPV